MKRNRAYNPNSLYVNFNSVLQAAHFYLVNYNSFSEIQHPAVWAAAPRLISNHSPKKSEIGDQK